MSLEFKLGQKSAEFLKDFEGFVLKSFDSYKKDVVESSVKAGFDAEEAVEKAVCLLVGTLFFIIGTKFGHNSFGLLLHRVYKFSHHACFTLCSQLIEQTKMSDKEVKALLKRIEKEFQTEVVEKVKHSVTRIELEDKKVH